MNTHRILAFVLLTGCTSAAPRAQGGVEVQGPHGVVGFRSGHALFYVVPVDSGVVLVDTGFDATGEDLLRAVAGRPIRGVLITHSHVDHWSGVHVVGAAPVYAGATEVATMRGLRSHRDFLNHLADRQWPRPMLPANLRSVEDGAAVELGGENFTPRVLPGHTAGSVVWLWRDVAFTGDALLFGDDGLARIVSQDVRRARHSVSLLWGSDIAVILDGHDGRADDAIARIERLIHTDTDEP